MFERPETGVLCSLYVHIQLRSRAPQSPTFASCEICYIAKRINLHLDFLVSCMLHVPIMNYPGNKDQCRVWPMLVIVRALGSRCNTALRCFCMARHVPAHMVTSQRDRIMPLLPISLRKIQSGSSQGEVTSRSPSEAMKFNGRPCTRRCSSDTSN